MNMNAVQWVQIQRWLFCVFFLVVGLVGISGCASTSVDSNRAEIVTDSDEPEMRKRARIRLELAVGYFVDQETHKEEMYIDELQEGKLALLNAAGILYEVAGDNFLSDPRLSRVEFVSKIETPVIKEIQVENILEELKKDASLTLVPYEKVLEAMKKRGKNPAEPKIKYEANRFG